MMQRDVQNHVSPNCGLANASWQHRVLHLGLASNSGTCCRHFSVRVIHLIMMEKFTSFSLLSCSSSEMLHVVLEQSDVAGQATPVSPMIGDVSDPLANTQREGLREHQEQRQKGHKQQPVPTEECNQCVRIRANGNQQRLCCFAGYRLNAHIMLPCSKSCRIWTESCCC